MVTNSSPSNKLIENRSILSLIKSILIYYRIKFIWEIDFLIVAGRKSGFFFFDQNFICVLNF